MNVINVYVLTTEPSFWI